MSEPLMPPADLVPLLKRLVEHSKPEDGLSVVSKDGSKVTEYRLGGFLVDPKDRQSFVVHAPLPASIMDGSFLTSPSRFNSQHFARLELYKNSDTKNHRGVWRLENYGKVALSYEEDGRWNHCRPDGSVSGWTGERPLLNEGVFRERHAALLRMLGAVGSGLDSLSERLVGKRPNELTAEMVRIIREEVAAASILPDLAPRNSAILGLLRQAGDNFWANA